MCSAHYSCVSAIMKAHYSCEFAIMKSEELGLITWIDENRDYTSLIYIKTQRFVLTDWNYILMHKSITKSDHLIQC